jgi:hypothetical protein
MAGRSSLVFIAARERGEHEENGFTVKPTEEDGRGEK